MKLDFTQVPPFILTLALISINLYFSFNSAAHFANPLCVVFPLKMLPVFIFDAAKYNPDCSLKEMVSSPSRSTYLPGALPHFSRRATSSTQSFPPARGEDPLYSQQGFSGSKVLCIGGQKVPSAFCSCQPVYQCQNWDFSPYLVPRGCLCSALTGQFIANDLIRLNLNPILLAANRDKRKFSFFYETNI